MILTGMDMFAKIRIAIHSAKFFQGYQWRGVHQIAYMLLRIGAYSLKMNYPLVLTKMAAS